MKTINEQEYTAWKAKNSDPYSNECFRFAEAWANLMEAALEQGKLVNNVAAELSHKADTERITGFMYGMAVSILAECWIHGKELKKWHNAEYGLPDADGVVNPAIITISS